MKSPGHIFFSSTEGVNASHTSVACGCPAAFYIEITPILSKHWIQLLQGQQVQFCSMHRTSHQKANQQGPGVVGLLIGLYQMSKPTAEDSNALQINRDGLEAGSK